MIKKFLSIVFLLVLINACSSNDGVEDPISLVDDFDRGSMLTNLSSSHK